MPMKVGTLVHVCRKWQTIVFWSRHRLDLQLLCTPALRHPCGGCYRATLAHHHTTTTIWRLREGRGCKHNDRVCQVTLWPVPSTHQKEVLTNRSELKLKLEVETAVGCSSFILRRICTTSTITLLETHPVSRITETSYDCH